MHGSAVKPKKDAYIKMNIIDFFQQRRIENLEEDLRNVQFKSTSEAKEYAVNEVSRVEQIVDMLTLINMAMWEILEKK